MSGRVPSAAPLHDHEPVLVRRSRQQTADGREPADFTFAWQGRRYQARLEVIRLAAEREPSRVWYVERDDGVRITLPDEELSQEAIMTRARQAFADLEGR